jgi:putative toxin-antitoxin system antitoxin component (TIGR02293 family)
MASRDPFSRLVPVIAHAVAVLGDERQAAHWLATPLALFHDRAPSELLGTDEGIALVEQALTRMEHGSSF